MVERFNRTLEEMLAKYVGKNHKDWDDHLQLVMLAYRSSVHEQQSRLLSLCLLGEKYGYLWTLCLVDQKYEKPRMNMENAYHEVRERTKAVQKRQEDYYNKRVSGEPFKKDDRVWVHQPCTGRPSQGNSINHGLVHTESSKEYQIWCIVFS